MHENNKTPKQTKQKTKHKKQWLKRTRQHKVDWQHKRMREKGKVERGIILGLYSKTEKSEQTLKILTNFPSLFH